MKTVVIFGGSGFVGQNIICRLARKDYRIIVPYQLSINEAKLRLFGNFGQIIPLKFYSLKDDSIQNIIQDSEVVLNLKTIWREDKYYSYKRNILNFNVHLVDLINSIDKNRPYVFFSGLGVSEKSRSRRTQYIFEAEKYIKKNIENSLIIRPGVIIGEGDQFLGKLLPIFKYSFFIPLFGNGNTKIQPVFIDDVAKALEIILDKGIRDNNIYELTGSDILTYKEIYKHISKCLGVRRVFIPVNFNLASMLVSLIEKTPINLITKEQLLLFREDNVSSKLHKNFNDFSFFPRDIREIIKKIIIK